MYKKIIGIVVLIVLAASLTACGEDITIDIVNTDFTLIEGGTHQIDFFTNDADGLNFESSDLEIVTVSTSGLVTAVSEGETTITVSSKNDPEIKVTINVTVDKNYTLSVPSATVILKVGETELAEYTANDDVTFSSSNNLIFTVDNVGLITAIAEGNANLTIQSAYNPALSETVEVIVRKIINLSLDSTSESLWVGGTAQVNSESNDTVVYSSSNESVASVNSSGLITGVAAGSATITVRSSYDDEVFEEVSIQVYALTETIMITGNNIVNMGTNPTLEIEVSPDLSYANITWESDDEGIVTIDENGLITAISTGIATITATSVADDSVTATFEIEVINFLIVDATKVLSDTVTLFGIDFEFGTHLFDNIEDALAQASPQATISVYPGTYAENIRVDKNGITIQGQNGSIFEGAIEVLSSDFTIDGFSFIGNSRIYSSNEISNFTFRNNEAVDLTLTDAPFLFIERVNGISILQNTITNLNQDAIVILDYLSGTVLVEKNIITNVDYAIYISSISEYNDTTEIKVSRNEIDQATVGIEINKQYSGIEKDILAYARFNSVTNSKLYAAKSQPGSTVDFTLNYWGGDETDPLLFPNIDALYLRGAYQAKAEIISEADFDPNLPVTFVITNPISDIILGDTHTFQYDVLPMELDTDKVRWITGNPEIMLVNTITGALTPLKSGLVTLTLRSSVDTSIKITISITVTTTPGIELTPSEKKNDLIVGDTLTLTATPFPFDISDSDVTFTSSHPLIATIDEAGLITTLATGDVTFTAALVDDPSVQTSYTMSIYSALDENNLLDLLTTYQLSFTTQHSWLQYGTSFNYTEVRYDSVSRYLFQNIDVNTSKLLPISNGIRPGILKPAHPEGITTYNPENVYWVVVHETANTAPGAGALSHANYLWNAAQAGTVLNVSWHYTMDARVTYQHVPENEIAYHAGDGSSLPGTSLTYLGGGNRNGIGIEMSVAQDEDMFLTFQRTAKLASDILVRYNLPRSHIKFHQDFSGKWCPQGMLRGGMVPVFQELADAEYAIRYAQGERTILFETNNPDYLDNTGRIIVMPDRPMTVSYTVTVTEGGVSTSRTFFTYLPGTVH
ncbi:MAG: hypothetical protein A2Y43_03395 [Tenericutes bacterium GWA2_38_26]|nr:MAG: hypothetical protein A2Y43_03395 [Tenericutes bacterium GWA2_38_26]